MESPTYNNFENNCNSINKNFESFEITEKHDTSRSSSSLSNSSIKKLIDHFENLSNNISSDVSKDIKEISSISEEDAKLNETYSISEDNFESFNTCATNKQEDNSSLSEENNFEDDSYFNQNSNRDEIDKSIEINDYYKNQISKLQEKLNNVKLNQDDGSINKKFDKKRKHEQNENARPEKFIAMAEQIYKFHFKTPARFHKYSKLDKPVVDVKYFHKELTNAKTPFLVSKFRTRPIRAISQQEKEQQELEEIQKNQFKATKLNKKILNEKIVPEKKDWRPPTKIEPFNITEMKKQISHNSPKVFNFVARPAPKFNKIVEIKSVKTKQSFNLTKNDSKLNDTLKNSFSTKVKPFSFEERDKNMQKKKQETLNKMIENEKKAREFHARPIPKFLKSTKSQENSNLTISSMNSTFTIESSQITMNSSSKNSSISQSKKFIAKPATVLYQKPFEPVKPSRILNEISEFQLNSDQRAKEREKKHQELKERTELLAKLAYLKKQEEELEQSLKFRKESEVKANPIRKFKKVSIKPSNKRLTQPISPRCLK